MRPLIVYDRKGYTTNQFQIMTATGTITTETQSGSVLIKERESVFTEQGIQDILWIEGTIVCVIGIIAFVLNFKRFFG